MTCHFSSISQQQATSTQWFIGLEYEERKKDQEVPAKDGAPCINATWSICWERIRLPSEMISPPPSPLLLLHPYYAVKLQKPVE